jgi:hypothetical protein
MQSFWMIAAWVLGGIVALVVGWVVFQIGWGIFGSHHLKGIEIQIDVPPTCDFDAEFDVVVRITNLLNKERIVRDFDIETSYLDGIMVLKVDPSPESSERSFGTWTHSMKRTIAPLSELVIRTRCKGVKCGDFSGDVTLYVDSRSLHWFTQTIRTIVADREDRRRGSYGSRGADNEALKSVTLT